jgi:hypothetical protein
MYGELVHQSIYGFHSFMHICTEHTAPSNHVLRLHSLLALPNGSAHAHTTRLPRKRRHPINIFANLLTMLFKHQCVYPVPSVLYTRVPCLYTQHTFCFTQLTQTAGDFFFTPPPPACACATTPRSIYPPLHPPRLNPAVGASSKVDLLSPGTPCKYQTQPNSSPSWHASQIESPLVPLTSSEVGMASHNLFFPRLMSGWSTAAHP